MCGGWVGDMIDKRDENIRSALGEDAGGLLSTALSPGADTYQQMEEARKGGDWWGGLHSLAAFSPASQAVDHAINNVGKYGDEKTSGQFSQYTGMLGDAISGVINNPYATMIISNLTSRQKNNDWYRKQNDMTKQEANNEMQNSNLKKAALSWAAYGIGDYLKGGADAGSVPESTMPSDYGQPLDKTIEPYRYAVEPSQWTGQGGEQAVQEMGKGLVYDSPEYLQAAQNLGIDPGVTLMDYWDVYGADASKEVLSKGAGMGFNALIGSLMGDMLPPAVNQNAVEWAGLKGGTQTIQGALEAKNDPSSMGRSNIGDAPTGMLSKSDITEMTPTGYINKTPEQIMSLVKKEEEKKKKATYAETIPTEYLNSYYA